MVDRKLMKNPNGLILGTPGSGKAFSAKALPRKITRELDCLTDEAKAVTGTKHGRKAVSHLKVIGCD